jgi:hypothetical protein
VTLYDSLPGETFVRPRVDLVLYVNSANDSRLSMGRVQELKQEKLRVRHPNYDPADCERPSNPADAEARTIRCRDYPLLVAITSDGDSATKFLLPAANTINGDDLVPSLADRLPALPTSNEFADRAPAAKTVKKVAAGHFGFLQSHLVHEINCPVRRSPQDRERALHPVCGEDDRNCRFIFRTFGDPPSCYQVDQRQPVDGKPPFNDTPFWIMSVEPTVIKDHGDIWNVSFLEMLAQLMAPRGFFEPRTARVQLRAGGSK